MYLKQLLEGLTGFTLKSAEKPDEIFVTGITHDYRLVKEGFLYVCLENEEYSEIHIQDRGENHIKEALHYGASCILMYRDLPGARYTRLLSDHPNALTAQLANRFYGYPLDQQTVVGITGTNGKTSVSFILKSIFEACGKTPGVAGTLGFLSSVYEKPTSIYTTPLAPELYANAQKFLLNGADSFILESTSHGIALGRESAIDYDAVIFTNFTQDHLDFHETLEDYRQTKLSLFRRLKDQKVKTRPVAVINMDDPDSAAFCEAAGGVALVSCSLRHPADYRARNLELGKMGSRFDIVVGNQQVVSVAMPLLGFFNVYNALLSFAAAHSLGLPVAGIIQGLANVATIPGRFEPVANDHGFSVFIDYAHTPDALNSALVSARALKPEKLITLFGCGGNRDVGKRSEMGRIASLLSDHVVITSDNPRYEDPDGIIANIVAGIDDSEMGQVSLIRDREQAIHKALSLAKPGDIVLIAGKGHEKSQIIGGVCLPFSDREKVEHYFAGSTYRENATGLPN